MKMMMVVLLLLLFGNLKIRLDVLWFSCVYVFLFQNRQLDRIKWASEREKLL